MAELENCLIPEDLQYHVEYNTWLRDNGDGTWDIGMTDIAQSMAGAILHCRPKKAGKMVKKGKGLATVESGKWVGPVRAPFDCEILATNELVESDPPILNKSPYKQAWIARVKPLEGESATAELLGPAAAVEAMRTYMAEHDLAECIHCEGFDG